MLPNLQNKRFRGLDRVAEINLPASSDPELELDVMHDVPEEHRRI